MTESLFEDGASRYLRAVAEARAFAPGALLKPRRKSNKIVAIFEEGTSYVYREVSVAIPCQFAIEFGNSTDLAIYTDFPALVDCAAWHLENRLVYQPQTAVDDAGNTVAATAEIYAAYFAVSTFSFLIEEAFDIAKDRVPTDDDFRAAYRARFDRWHDQAPLAQLIVPIHGISLPPGTEEFVVNDEIRLVALTASEKNSGWYWPLRDYTGTNPGQLARCRLALVVDRTRRIEEDTHCAASMFLTALRLAPIETFRAPDTFYKYLERSVASAATGPLHEFGPIPRSFNSEPVILAAVQLELTREIYRELAALSEVSLKRLETALTRFRMSFVRDRQEDAVLDLVIALESLLLPSEKDSELAFRFKINAVLMLPDELSLEDREDAMGIFSELYIVRSLVVHKGKSVVDCQKRVRNKLKINDWPTFYARALRLSTQIIRRIVTEMGNGSPLELIQDRLLRKAAGLIRN